MDAVNTTGFHIKHDTFFLIFYLDYHDTWHYSLFYKEGCTNACLSYSQTTLALNVEPGGCYGGDRVFECILPM